MLASQFLKFHNDFTGSDYDPLPLYINVNKRSSDSFYIQTVPDTVVEHNESFIVIANHSINEISCEAATVVTILNDDGKFLITMHFIFQARCKLAAGQYAWLLEITFIPTICVCLTPRL